MYREHIPVLFDAVLAFLQPKAGGKYIDGTLGAGGHAIGIFQASAPSGRLLAFDRDQEAIAFAGERFAEVDNRWNERVSFVHASYAEMGEVAPERGFDEVDGVLLDLGLSSRQLGKAERGFSFQLEGPLDMRFDPTHDVTAADLVNNLPEADLAELLWRYGEERHSRRYAREIVRSRPLATTSELAAVIAGAARGPRERLHPATKTFQALRIAVNEELTALEKGIAAAVDLLRPGGRLVIISFHSLEDRIVKRALRDLSRSCICPPKQPICTCNVQPVLRLVTRKAVSPSEAEAASNPRSRSAKLRAAEKLLIDAGRPSGRTAGAGRLGMPR
jgi:16S rRNA (cytosine1402-N4)-methyltransferase